MTYVDLDKSNIGTSTDNVATGPTLGAFPQLVNGSRVITAAGTYTVLPYDRILLCGKTVPAAFSIQLPDVALWMKNQYGLLPITVVDLAANAGTYNITVLPFGSQTINGAASYSIATNSACVTFMPLNTLAGWVIIASNLASALSNTAVTPGTYGSSTQAGQFTVQADGRLTFGGNVTIVPADTAVTPGAYGDATHVGAFTVDQKGRLTAASSVAITSNNTASITFIIDGSGSAITTGVKGDLVIPFACTINSATLLADQSGSIVVNIWKDVYANYPPTVADKITASAPPTITTATNSQDTTLSGWTTSITAGDTLRFNVDSVTTITFVTLALKVTKT